MLLWLLLRVKYHMELLILWAYILTRTVLGCPMNYIQWTFRIALRIVSNWHFCLRKSRIYLARNLWLLIQLSRLQWLANIQSSPRYHLIKELISNNLKGNAINRGTKHIVPIIVQLNFRPIFLAIKREATHPIREPAKYVIAAPSPPQIGTKIK